MRREKGKTSRRKALGGPALGGRALGGRCAARQGAALLLALTVVYIAALFTVHILDTTTLDLAALRNTIEYDRALLLANAGVHAAAAELELNRLWRGTLTDGSFPADDTYTVTAVNGPTSNTVAVTAKGAAGNVVRTVAATLQL